MNTVLIQEVIRYNKLLNCMWSTLQLLQKALKGFFVMSEELELMANSLFDNQVPIKWADVGFLSLKPLASWVEDLNKRICARMLYFFNIVLTNVYKVYLTLN